MTEWWVYYRIPYIPPRKCGKNFVFLRPVPGGNTNCDNREFNLFSNANGIIIYHAIANAHPLLLRNRRRMLRGSEARNLRANVSEGVRNLVWWLLLPIKRCFHLIFARGAPQSEAGSGGRVCSASRTFWKPLEFSSQPTSLPLFVCLPLNFTCRAFSLSSASRASCSLRRFASSTFGKKKVNRLFAHVYYMQQPKDLLLKPALLLRLLQGNLSLLVP